MPAKRRHTVPTCPGGWAQRRTILRKTRGLRALVTLAAFGLALLPVVVRAQAATPAAAYSLPPLQLPGPADGEALLISRVEFVGRQSLPEADLQALAAPFLNRPLRLLDVEELRQRVTRAYVDRGYVNSGALLPEQALQSGTLRLTIIEGRITQTRFQGLDGLNPNYLRSRLLRPDEPLALPQLQQRFATLLDDPMIERMNARLLPGQALGESTLDVELTRARPWRLALFANNQGAPAVGSAVAGAELQLFNLSSWGDQLAATLSRSGGSTQYDLGWTLPLAASRSTVQLRAARSHSSVIEEPLSTLDLGSRVDTQEISFNHPVLDNATQRLSLGLSYARRDNRTTLDGEPFSFVAGEASGTTRVRAWRFFQDATLRLDRHVLALRSTFVFGRNNLPAETLVHGQPSTQYRLWVGQAQGALALGDGGALLVLRGLLQYSRDALVPLEQISIGGRYTVRGYRENTLVRDRGWATSAELHWPLATGSTPRRRLWLLPFVDAGSAHNQGGKSQRLASAGLGLRAQFDNIDAEIYVARRLERRPVDTRGDLQDHGIHLSVRWLAF